MGASGQVDETSEDVDDHDNLGSESVWVLLNSIDNRVVSHEDLQDFNIVDNGNKVCGSMLEHLISIIINWSGSRRDQVPIPNRVVTMAVDWR